MTKGFRLRRQIVCHNCGFIRTILRELTGTIKCSRCSTILKVDHG